MKPRTGLDEVLASVLMCTSSVLCTLDGSTGRSGCSECEAGEVMCAQRSRLPVRDVTIVMGSAAVLIEQWPCGCFWPCATVAGRLIVGTGGRTCGQLGETLPFAANSITALWSCDRRHQDRYIGSRKRTKWSVSVCTHWCCAHLAEF